MLNLVVDYLSLFLSEMWSLCLDMAPFLLMGMFVSGVISMFVNSRLILKHIGSKNFLSIFKSTVLGYLFLYVRVALYLLLLPLELQAHQKDPLYLFLYLLLRQALTAFS